MNNLITTSSSTDTDNSVTLDDTNPGSTHSRSAATSTTKTNTSQKGRATMLGRIKNRIARRALGLASFMAAFAIMASVMAPSASAYYNHYYDIPSYYGSSAASIQTSNPEWNGGRTFTGYIKYQAQAGSCVYVQLSQVTSGGTIIGNWAAKAFNKCDGSMAIVGYSRTFSNDYGLGLAFRMCKSNWWGDTCGNSQLIYRDR